jgi:hypothetical protein
MGNKLLTGLSCLVLLQIRKIATILRRLCVIATAIELRRIGPAGRASLSRRLDHVAIGSAGQHAVLQLARRGEIMGEPDPDRKQDDRDHKAGDRAAAVVTLFGVGFGHGTVVSS